MKRHPALEPFSRDHNTGLIVARRLQLDGSSALPLFREAWQAELKDHFDEEERLLLPLCPADASNRLVAEHRAIRSLGDTAAEDDEARRLGELLNDHIRWEERELFVSIERSANEASLRSLAVATADIEGRRTDPRRAELVARRAAMPVKPIAIDLGYLASVAVESGPQWGMATEDLNATLLVWDEGQGIDEHVNDSLDVLAIVVSGEIEVVMDGEALRLRAGQALAIPKGARRSIRAVSPKAAYLTVHQRRSLV